MLEEMRMRAASSRRFRTEARRAPKRLRVATYPYCPARAAAGKDGRRIGPRSRRRTGQRRRRVKQRGDEAGWMRRQRGAMRRGFFIGGLFVWLCRVLNDRKFLT